LNSHDIRGFFAWIRIEKRLLLLDNHDRLIYEVVAMSDEILKSIEGHMSQLIQMVAENNQLMKQVLKRMDRLEERMDNFEQRMDQSEQKFDLETQISSLRHEEVVKEMRSSRIDLDYLRNESSKHDMEINKIKTLIQS
jgi:chromosome segregation ATPase